MKKKIVMVMGLLLVLSLLLGACAAGISQEDYDEVVTELGSLQVSLNHLVLAADLVRGGGPGAQGVVCVLNNQFKNGESVVFRVRVTDGETGVQIPSDPADLVALDPVPEAEAVGAMAKGIEVVIHLSDGQSLPMHYGAHSLARGEPPADYFWTVSWAVPEDYPTGTIDYWVTVDWTAESKTGRWDSFNVSSSKLTIIE